MVEVPLWLAFVTPTVAVGALVVAVWSLVTARSSLRIVRESLKTAQATFERAGPQVQGGAIAIGKLDDHGEIDPDRSLLHVRLHNKGLAGISIESITARSPDFLTERHTRWIELETEGEHTSIPGLTSSGAFPYALAGQTSCQWTFAMKVRLKKPAIEPPNGDLELVRAVLRESPVCVGLGNGEVLKVPIQVF